MRDRLCGMPAEDRPEGGGAAAEEAPKPEPGLCQRIGEAVWKCLPVNRDDLNIHSLDVRGVHLEVH